MKTKGVYYGLGNRRGQTGRESKPRDNKQKYKRTQAKEESARMRKRVMKEDY